MGDKNKRGQVTIFVIIALVLIVGVVLIYSFFPEIKSTISNEDQNPAQYMQSCVEDELKENVNLIAMQGGSLEPEFFYEFGGSPVEYWCYTPNYYELCTVQQPSVIPRIEKEIKKSISKKVDQCLDSMRENYANKGYSVKIEKGDLNVFLFTNRVSLTINSSLTLSKSSTETYDSFVIILDNNIYELASIARSILEWEYSAGQIDSDLFNSFFRGFTIKEENNNPDRTKVYVIKKDGSEETFRFASRSQVKPLGVATIDSP